MRRASRSILSAVNMNMRRLCSINLTGNNRTITVQPVLTVRWFTRTQCQTGTCQLTLCRITNDISHFPLLNSEGNKILNVIRKIA